MPMIKWKVLRKRHAHNQKKRQCISYLNKKYEIANFKRENSLNKRTDILVPADRETNIKLEIATQTSDVINHLPVHLLDFVMSYYVIYLAEDWEHKAKKTLSSK